MRCFKMVAVLLVVWLAGCAGAQQASREASLGVDYLAEVERLRAEAKRRPMSVETRTALSRMETRASRHFYEEGMALQRDGAYEAALTAYQRGLMVFPGSEKLAQAASELMLRIEAERYYRDGLQSLELERKEEARKAFAEALRLFPEHLDAEVALRRLNQQEPVSRTPMSSDERITLNFQRADIRTLYDFLGKAFGLNVLFDEGVKSTPVTLFAQGVTVRQALELLTAASDTFYKQIGPNTLLVIPETPQKRAQYDEFLIRTFYLRVIQAKDMASIIKGVLNPKQMIVSESLNSIMVRDTEGVLSLVENLIRTNDLRPAELILDVEILEISRNKTEQLGIDYGSRISMTFPQDQRHIMDALRGGTYTLPAISLQYLKQDVDARTLANPKVRVVHGSSAKIHIGDRVPLRSSTVQDATGQVRTSFEYRDIGIRLTVEPHVHLDNSVSVKMGLEVSSLGQNLGTQNEPAYSIGTRNAETEMLLRDGETAVLGGLIRDEDRNAVSSLPGLGSLPAVGRLFRADDRAGGTTDVLLTITPQVVRSWDLPERSAREMYSGTERRYTNEVLFAQLSQATSGEMPVISVSGERNDPAPAGTETASPLPSPPPGERLLSEHAAQPTVPPSVTPEPRLAFSESLYHATPEQELTVEVLYQGPAVARSVDFQLLYNPRVLQYLSVEGAQGNPLAEGTLHLRVDGLPEAMQPTAIGRVALQAKGAGSSYLAYRIPPVEGGDSVVIQTGSGRVQVE